MASSPDDVTLYRSHMSIRWSSLKTGPAWPGHTKIALDITAVKFDQFSLYSTVQ